MTRNARMLAHCRRQLRLLHDLDRPHFPPASAVALAADVVPPVPAPYAHLDGMGTFEPLTPEEIAEEDVLIGEKAARREATRQRKLDWQRQQRAGIQPKEQSA